MRDVEHHAITWAIEDQALVGTPTCTAPVGAVCRLAGRDECQCESWNLQRDKDGPYHLVLAFDGTDDRVRHSMVDSGQCQVVSWLTNEDASLTELGPEHGTIPLGTTTIRPVWTGDGYGWEPVTGDAP